MAEDSADSLLDLTQFAAFRFMVLAPLYLQCLSGGDASTHTTASAANFDAFEDALFAVGDPKIGPEELSILLCQSPASRGREPERVVSPRLDQACDLHLARQRGHCLGK